MAVTEQHLVVHERNTRLVGLDPVEGSVRWDVPVGTWPRAVVVAEPHCLVIPQNTGGLLCLDVETGEDIWQAEPGSFAGHVVVDEELVLVGGWRGYTPLSAVDLRTGVPRWRAGTHGGTVLPAVTEAGFLLGEPGGDSVRLIDRDDGRELTTWSLPEPLAGPDVGPAFRVEGGGFLTRCGDRLVVRIVPAEAKAEIVFRAERDLAPRAVDLCGGLLWLAGRRGGYTVVDPSDGAERWRIQHDRRFVASVASVAGGFAIADEGGSLFRIDLAGLVSERARLTQRIRDLREQGPSKFLLLAKGSLLAVDASRPSGHVHADHFGP